MSKPAANHPDFDATPPDYRWERPLPELFAVLAKEAYQTPERWQAYRVLRHGAFVQMRAAADPGNGPVRLELRIARRQVPADPEAWKKFGQEVETFRRLLAPDLGRRWGMPVVETLRDDTVAAATCLALFVGEVERGKTICTGPWPGTDCPTQAIIPHDPAFPEDRCTACAIAAGGKETRENVERRVDERREGQRREHPEPYGGHA